MNSRSIYFLQALWDVEVQRDRLLQIAKNSMLYEIEQTLHGVLNNNTLWLSTRSKEISKKIESLKNEIALIECPNDLLKINEAFINASAEISAMQIKTAQTLNARSGLLMNNMHILVKQLFPFALLQIKSQTKFQLYRLMVLTGSISNEKLYFPEGDIIQEWIYFYEKKLLPLIDLLDINTLDSRWAYERKRVLLNGKIQVEQFVSAEPTEEELKQPLGIPSIGTGNNGEFRIFGRGRITNLRPDDFENGFHIHIQKAMPKIEDFSKLPNENNNPQIILKKIFGEMRYLISATEYFEFLNKYMIATDFYHRIKTGSCLHCGAPLYMNKCSKCGRIWRV